MILPLSYESIEEVGCAFDVYAIKSLYIIRIEIHYRGQVYHNVNVSHNRSKCIRLQQFSLTRRYI